MAVEVPPNTSAFVALPGGDELEVGSGRHEWRYDVTVETARRWSTPLDPFKELA